MNKADNLHIFSVEGSMAMLANIFASASAENMLVYGERKMDATNANLPVWYSKCVV